MRYSIATRAMNLAASLVAAASMPGAKSDLSEGVWSNAQKLFVFGDSYSTVGFNTSTGPQPNATNPLGNPPYPGYTSSNGPNWVDYLTVKYNESVIQTYNLAYGGATVDSALAAPYLPTVLSLQQQVQQEFLPIYTGPNAQVVWDANSTIFAFWFGINDVGNTYSSSDTSEYSAVYTSILEQYAYQVNSVFMSGARQFLFLNVPPVQRSPLTTAQGANASSMEIQAISIFNDGIANMSKSLYRNATALNEDVSVYTFDAYSLFSAVLDDPKAFALTTSYVNTTDYCPAYENGTPEETSYDSSCVAPVNEYFWLNTLHPTFPMHDLLASQLSATLQE